MSGLNVNVPAGGFWRDSGDYQPGVNRLFLSFVSGAAGAVPTSYLQSNGFDVAVNPVVRNSTGNYTATLDANWAQYFAGGGSVQQQPGSYNAALAFDVKVIAVSLANRTIAFVTTRPDTGVVADMASGDVINLFLMLGSYTEPTAAGAS